MIKRSLTARKFLSGIGKACSDEILHHARISPMRQIRYFEDDEWQRLFDSKQKALVLWIEKLRAETGDKFPAKITAFHADMAVHGKYKAPCPDCGKPVQRIRYASNECNYCANCQNQGNLLADQSLSSLLKKDWPKTLEELGETLFKVHLRRAAQAITAFGPHQNMCAPVGAPQRSPSQKYPFNQSFPEDIASAIQTR